jgi:alcohol dehydrogenase
MRSLFFLEPHKLEWRDVAAPTLLDPGDALVRPTHATLCDIDPLIIRGIAPIPGPFPIGHEAIGEVVAVGSAVTRLTPGQRVALTYYDLCGACRRCRNARPNRCEVNSPDILRRRWHGVGMTEAGYFSDLVRVPAAERACLPLPEGVAAEHLASLGDNIGFGYEYVVPHLARFPGADVLVMGGGGAGSIGLYATAFAVAAGAGKVVYADFNDDRLAIAEAFGARLHRGAPPRALGVFPITVDASGAHEGLLCAIRSTEVEGICSSVGGHFQPAPMPLLEMYAKGIHFYTGPGRGLPNMADALALIAARAIDLAPVTSDILPWADADRARATLPRKPVFVRD